MKQNTMTGIIAEQTKRALWEIKNVIDCVPDSLWNKEYCDMPLWKHIYIIHCIRLIYGLSIHVIKITLSQVFIQKI